LSWVPTFLNDFWLPNSGSQLRRLGHHRRERLERGWSE
jgi:hypothetical protein